MTCGICGCCAFAYVIDLSAISPPADRAAATISNTGCGEIVCCKVAATFERGYSHLLLSLRLHRVVATSRLVAGGLRNPPRYASEPLYTYHSAISSGLLRWLSRSVTREHSPRRISLAVTRSATDHEDVHRISQSDPPMHI